MICGKASSKCIEREVKKKIPIMMMSPATASHVENQQHKDRRQNGWAPFGLTSFFFYFIFMVVGTQDKGHKVSIVQVMPLSLGALPSEEVPRCQTAAYTGRLQGGNPHGDINKEQKRASGGLFILSRAMKSARGTFGKGLGEGFDS